MTRFFIAALVFACLGCDSLGFETREGRVLLDGALFDYDFAEADLLPGEPLSVLSLRFSDRGDAAIAGDEIDLTLWVELDANELVVDRAFTVEGRARFSEVEQAYPEEEVVFTRMPDHDESLERVFVNVACEHRGEGEVLQDLTGSLSVEEVRDDAIVIDVRVDGEGIPFAERFAPFEIDGKIELPITSE